MVTQTTQTQRVLELVGEMGILRPRDLVPYGIPEHTSAVSVQLVNCGGLPGGDVIKLPFPYTDRPTRKSRPALIVSSGKLEELHGLLWVVMITSAQNRAWPKDITVSNLKQAGLPSPSVIRTVKIATIEAVDTSKIGSISPSQLKAVKQLIIPELN